MQRVNLKYNERDKEKKCLFNTNFKILVYLQSLLTVCP